MKTFTDNRRFIAYLFAGGINTLFGYGVYTALVLFGMLPHVAVVAGGVAGILFNFLTTSAVFRSYDFRRLPRFLLVYAFVLGLNILLLDLLLRFGLGPLMAQAVVLPIFALTFVAMRRFVFAPLPEQTS
ncbi:MAG: GtrA family protein [Sphingopyxis sp.]|nr:GtrA family protein [Sphingopyxis sp.]